MTKIERKYLRAAFLHFHEKLLFEKPILGSDMPDLLRSMNAYHQIVLEVLSLESNDNDTDDLDQIFEDNNIEISNLKS